MDGREGLSLNGNLEHEKASHSESFLGMRSFGWEHTVSSLHILDTDCFPEYSLPFMVVYAVLWGFPGGSDSKESACNAGDLSSIPGFGRSPEKEIATHSSILAWRIPWTEEPGRLQSKGVKRVGQEWATNTTVSYTEGFNVAMVKLVNLFLFMTSGFYDWEELSYSQIIKVVP